MARPDAHGWVESMRHADDRSWQTVLDVHLGTEEIDTTIFRADWSWTLLYAK